MWLKRQGKYLISLIIPFIYRLNGFKITSINRQHILGFRTKKCPVAGKVAQSCLNPIIIIT